MKKKDIICETVGGEGCGVRKVLNTIGGKWKILILCAAAAVLGAGCRLVLTETMGIAAWISAAAAFALVLLLAWRWGLWFPPAGAVTLLAYLVPARGLPTYFLWIALGAAALGASAVAVRLITKKQTDKPLRY